MAEAIKSCNQLTTLDLQSMFSVCMAVTARVVLHYSRVVLVLLC